LDIGTAGTAFGLLFVMELGDKTQLAVFSLSGRTRRGVAVFVGATAALLVLAAAAAALGEVAAEFLPERALTVVAGVGFLAIGLFVLWSSLRGGRGEGDGESVASGSPDRRGALSVAALAFGLTLVAELGDKSQLAVIAISARTGKPVEVFAGAAAALALVTLLGALAGAIVAHRVPQRLVSRVAGAVFVVIGALTLAGMM